MVYMGSSSRSGEWGGEALQYNDGDDDLLYKVLTKVRVQVQALLQNRFCRAIIATMLLEMVGTTGRSC